MSIAYPNIKTISEIFIDQNNTIWHFNYKYNIIFVVLKIYPQCWFEINNFQIDFNQEYYHEGGVRDPKICRKSTLPEPVKTALTKFVKKLKLQSFW